YIEKAPQETNWLTSWIKMEQITREKLLKAIGEQLAEGEAVREMVDVLPADSRLFVANSMPVRDLDTFLLPTDKNIIVHANRGVSGIDGTVSSALGIAATTKEHVILVVGDLS